MHGVETLNSCIPTDELDVGGLTVEIDDHPQGFAGIQPGQKFVFLLSPALEGQLTTQHLPGLANVKVQPAPLDGPRVRQRLQPVAGRGADEVRAGSGW